MINWSNIPVGTLFLHISDTWRFIVDIDYDPYIDDNVLIVTFLCQGGRLMTVKRPFMGYISKDVKEIIFPLGVHNESW